MLCSVVTFSLQMWVGCRFRGKCEVRKFESDELLCCTFFFRFSFLLKFVEIIVLRIFFSCIFAGGVCVYSWVWEKVFDGGMEQKKT